MKYKLFIINVLIFSNIYGQETITPLTVGDTLPDFIIPEILNSKESTINSSTLKKGLLILDFWNTYCMSCIEAMPRMESLQKRFGNKIKILPVTFQKSELISSFLKKNQFIKNLSLPTVVNDKFFTAFFPHIGDPFEVWIYNGKVIGITSPFYVDVPNITKILSGEKIDWVTRFDFFKFDKSKPLFDFEGEKYGSIHKNITRSSAISDYNSEVSDSYQSAGRGIFKDTVQKINRFYSINESIYFSYIQNWIKALGNRDLIKPSNKALDSNQVIWEVADRSKYRQHIKYSPYQQEWNKRNAICFESIYSDTGETEIQLYQRVIRDMDRLLGLHVRWEKRIEKVWVLKNKLFNKKVFPLATRVGVYLDLLVSTFNNQEEHCYVFNETKGMEDLWMDIKIDGMMSLKEVNLKINTYNLEMNEEKREVDKLVFTEVDGGLLIDHEIGTAERIKKTVKKNLDDASE